MEKKNIPTKEAVERIQKGLKISYEEAVEIAVTDLEIDKGADPFPQTKEQKKASDVARRADRKVTEVTIERKRKENPTKGGIIKELATFLENNPTFSCQNVKITNKERMISFSVGSDNFEVTLTQKRQPKKGKL